MGAEAKPNSFRAAVIRGERAPLVIADKEPRRTGSGEALDEVVVPRTESRRGNHRNNDRHGLSSETASASCDGQRHDVEVINLSAGGAMVRAGFTPRLWDIIELEFGHGFTVESAVRWLRDGCIGVEFAHETRIESEPGERMALLLEVVQRSFPGQPVRLDHQDPEIFSLPEDDLGARLEKRHPLIWRGELHHAYDSYPVRLRNISSGGALLDVQTHLPLQAEVLLDLGGAGRLTGQVTWTSGDQVGLKFHHLFDLANLSKSRPDITPNRWLVPDFLNGIEDDSSPWHSSWSRSSVEDIRSDLEGYLKR